MKRAQKILEAASARLDVPGEIMARLPKVEITGFSKLSVEQHNGILEYTDEVVTVAVSFGRIRVIGSGLSISLMNHGYIIVVGNLQCVEMIAGDAHA